MREVLATRLIAGSAMDVDSLRSIRESRCRALGKMPEQPNVFISYGTQDRHTSAVLAEELRRRGFRVWLDVAELCPGESIAGAISAQLAEADVILVLLSRASAASPWCRAEYEAALTQEIETGSKRVVPVVLDDVTVPPLLAAKKRIDLRRRSLREGLSSIVYELEKILQELPITAMEPARPRYHYSRLAMIIAGVLDELPVPSFGEERLLEGRTLVDLYRAVDRLIGRFEDVCRQLASVLGEACRGPVSYPSISNLRSTDVSEANISLIRVATDMREIAQDVREIVASDTGVFHRLAMVSELCTTISLNEDVLVVILSTPKEIPAHLQADPGDPFSVSRTLRRLDSDARAFDSAFSRWGEPSLDEVSDLERVVSDMNRYRSELRSAIADAASAA
jgi:hypothetical protein